MRLKLIALFSAVLLCSLSAFAFESGVVSKDASGKLVYEQVVEAPGVSKKDLYKKVRAWVMENIKSWDNHVQLDDPENETLITTPTMSLPDLKNNHATNQKINFKLKIAFKDGKYKITASSFTYFGESIQHQLFADVPLEDLKFKRILPDPVKKIQDQFDEAFTSFTESIKKAAVAAKSDW